MTIYKGKLFAGTSTCHGRAEARPTTDAGKVFSWEAGGCVSYDRDIGTRWNHIVAVRQAQHLRLYIDGKLVSSETEPRHPNYNLSNNQPLLIGFGAKNFFTGNIRDLRVYNRTLSQEEIAQHKSLFASGN